MLGIDVKSDSEFERLNLRAINKGSNSWIKRNLSFDENFNNLKWEEVLEDKNIIEITKKIKQLVDEIDSFKTE